MIRPYHFKLFLKALIYPFDKVGANKKAWRCKHCGLSDYLVVRKNLYDNMSLNYITPTCKPCYQHIWAMGRRDLLERYLQQQYHKLMEEGNYTRWSYYSGILEFNWPSSSISAHLPQYEEARQRGETQTRQAQRFAYAPPPPNVQTTTAGTTGTDEAPF